MRLTNEQIQSILDGAPEDEWTHYCTRNRHYYKRDGNTDRMFVWLGGTKVWSVPLMDAVRWLERRERLEEILELRREVEWLKAQQSEVAAEHIEYACRQYSIGVDVAGQGMFDMVPLTQLLDYANQLREQSK